MLNVRVGNATTTIELGGELDVSAADGLLDRLYSELARGAAEVVMDLKALSFIDSTGLRTLLQARDLCERHGARLSIVEGRGHVARVFELTGLDSVLPVVPPAARLVEATE
jgi:anti-sigma B factor antagonist